MSFTTESPFPKNVYKILETNPPSPIPHTLPLSDLDAQDGFIHLSTAPRIAETASLFFTSHTTIWVLKISSAEAQKHATLKWVEGLPGCVHMHGAEAHLGAGNVMDVRSFKRRGEGQNWVEVIQEGNKDAWLL